MVDGVHPPPRLAGLIPTKLERRKLKLKANIETGSSYFSFKR